MPLYDKTTTLVSRRLHLFIYDSVEELLAGATGELPRGHYDPELTRADFIGRDFSGWQDVIQACHEPWQEGIQQIEDMAARLQDSDLPRPESRRRKRRFSEDGGDEVDYDRLRSGQPFWQRCRRENTHGPATVTVIIDMSTAASREADTILWRGAAAIAMANVLEQAGYRCEIWAVNSVTGVYGGESGAHACKLKDASAPLDVSTLASTISGWFFRTVFFRVTCSHEGLSPAHGLGRPEPMQDKHLDLLSRDENRFYVHDAWNYRDALEQVRGYLQSMCE